MSVECHSGDLLRFCGKPISRRESLRLGLVGAAGWAVAESPGVRMPARPVAQAAEAAKAPKAKARSVIHICLSGGPPHLETFDPKPDAGRDYNGGWGAIPTNVPGIQLGKTMVFMARCADKFSIIRSMTHRDFGHETAWYYMCTGRQPGGRYSYPAPGAVVAHFKGTRQAGYDNPLPPWIMIASPFGRFSQTGFMGLRYEPFVTGGDPSQKPFQVEGVVVKGLTDEDQRKRREMLHRLATLEQAMKGHRQLEDARASEKQAYDMILGDAGKAFDVSQEKEEVRDLYCLFRGKPPDWPQHRLSWIGGALLVARRLVERGVPFVTINSQAWDTHWDHFGRMNTILVELDSAVAALLGDLSDRGLLDTTVVVMGGEYGRKPKIDWQAPWNGGRDHYPLAFSYMVAGGGFKGGVVVGATDAKGEHVTQRPVYAADLWASVYTLLGIDPDSELPNPFGERLCLMPEMSKGVREGLLKEIM